MRHLIFVILTVFCSILHGLYVEERTLKGTETLKDSLTPKQLAIQRWFSQLTYLQDIGSWDGWGDALNDLDCDGNTCIRYEISSLAYTAAVLGSKTPAYTQLTETIMYNAIMRMIQKPVWQYIELFDDFKDQPTYPDPVIYKNIMYSGHLAQMISLYESITGNMTFSSAGWSFNWGSDSEFPEPIHYNTEKLMNAIYTQTSLYEGALGGVPCEPDSIFVICNNYPMNAFILHDEVHRTEYAYSARTSWQETIAQHGVNRVPDVENADNNFFNLDYLIHPLGIWEPIASVGSDVWALAWMGTWWNTSVSSNSRRYTASDLLADAYSSILQSNQWRVDTVPASSTMSTQQPQQQEQQQQQEQKQAWLQPGDVGNKIFPFSPEITTSFFPMIYKQFNPLTAAAASSSTSISDNSKSAVNSTITSAAAATAGVLLEQTFCYFEYNYGRFFDSDGDGVRDSFQYNTALPSCSQQLNSSNISSSLLSSSSSSVMGEKREEKSASSDDSCDTGDYSVWATANLALGMVLPQPQENPDYLRSLFLGVPLFKQNLNKPKVVSTDYPNVMVAKAVFEEFSTFSASTADTTTLQEPSSLQDEQNQNQNQHQKQKKKQKREDKQRYVDERCSCPTGGSLSVTFLPGDIAPTSPHTIFLSTGCPLPTPTAEAYQSLSPCSHNVTEVSAFLQKCTTVQLHGATYPSALMKPAEKKGLIKLTAPGWSAKDSLNFPQDFIINFC